MRAPKYVAVTLAIFLLYELLTSLAQALVFGGVWEPGLTHGDLIWSFLFVHFFIKSCPECDLAAGARFGLPIGIFFCSPLVFGFFPLREVGGGAPEVFSIWSAPEAILPGVIPSAKAVAWFGLTVLKITACGVAAAALHRVHRRPAVTII